MTAKKVEAKLADGDIRGAIRLAISDDTIAPNDGDTVAALLVKHPFILICKNSDLAHLCPLSLNFMSYGYEL